MTMTMTNVRRLLRLAAGLLAGIAVFAIWAARAPAQQQGIGKFFDDFSDEWVRSSPSQAAASRYFTGPEQDLFEQQLTPQTAEFRRRRIQLAQKGLEDLKRFDRTRISNVDRVSADLMEWLLDTVVRGEPFQDFDFPVNQYDGANVSLANTLTVTHPLQTEKDAANYLARLRLVGVRMSEATAEAKRLAAKGLMPPRFILQATATQLQRFIDSPPAQNPFVTAYADRMAASKSVPEARRHELSAEAARIVDAEVYPAWRAALEMVKTLVPTATDNAGLWRYKDGPAAYAHALRRFTTTTMTPEEIHQLGLRQVQKIETEMDGILRRLGRTQGSVKNRVEQLKKDLGYPLTEDGRKVIMADTEQMLRDAERRAATLFDHRPKAPVVVQPYPRFREANAPASYNAPARDGSRPGTFQIPLRPERMTKFSLRSLVYHETVPGHHFQIALEMEDEALPRFRRLRALGGISAFSEGWGLYAERLAAEEGWYEGDLEGRLGQLDSELFRARRLVVDTGLHAKRWTRQQAIDYGIEASEVERYVMNPGQACSYMIGELKLIESRDKARAALGDRFAFKDFHNFVLGLGTVPLAVLEREVASYIRTRG